jgi:hypothetical protein
LYFLRPANEILDWKSSYAVGHVYKESRRKSAGGLFLVSLIPCKSILSAVYNLLIISQVLVEEIPKTHGE